MKFFSSEMMWKYIVPGVVVFTLMNSPLANAESFVDLSSGEAVSERVKKVYKKKAENKPVQKQQAPKTIKEKTIETVKNDPQAAEASGTFLPDATLPVLSTEAYVDHEWMVSFYPLAGWELKKTPGMALSMTEPVGLTTRKSVTKGYDKSAEANYVETSQTKFKRSISLARIEGGVPFDRHRLESFEQGLLDTFGKKMGLQNFALVNSAEFFDHRAEKDAIVAYTQFSTKNHELKQMHVLVGGATNQVHLVYTDIADHFETRSDFINKAWSSMTSVNVEGTSPQPLWGQVEKYIPFAAAGMLLLFLLVLIQKMQLRNNMRKAIAEIDLQEGEYSEYKSETVWNIENVAPQTNWMHTSNRAPARVSQRNSQSAPKSRLKRHISGMAPISNIFGSQF